MRGQSRYTFALFFFNDTATTEIYTLSLHDALPIFGAFLSKIGEDVTFIDMWPEHVEKMRADGLHVTGSQGPFTVPVKAIHLTEAQNISEPFDFVFISVKSYDTEWATHFIKRYVREDGYFISLQNCWNDVPMGEIVGSSRQLGCIASQIEVALWEPALVTRGGAGGRDR